MDFVAKGLLKNFWRPGHCSFRCRSRINVGKPKPPHFERAKLLKLCEPLYPKMVNPETPVTELCKGPSKGSIVFHKDNPYEDILAKEVLNWFRNHKYNFFYHFNSMPYAEYTELRIMLNRLGVRTQKYGKRILQKAFNYTKYESTLVLIQGHTLLGFGNEVDIKKMMGALKNCNIVLMAGIIDDRLFSVNELRDYCELPDIQTLRSSLVSVLNSLGGQIVQQLNHHPSSLVQNLDMHAKNSQEGKLNDDDAFLTKV